MAYEKYIIDSFIKAWFEQDYSELPEEEFIIVHAEYMDTSGLYMTEDFEKRGLINHLSQRINYVKMFLRLQREFISEFKMPFIRDFDILKEKYGYILNWREDLEDFENQLKKVELREVKHHSFLEEKIKELEDSKKKTLSQPKENDKDALKKSRISFIRMLNSLAKIGYKVDRKSTYVEELSLMIKQQLEDVEDQRNSMSK